MMRPMRHILDAVLLVLAGIVAGFVHAKIERVAIGAAVDREQSRSDSTGRFTSRGYPFVTLDYAAELFSAHAADFVDAGTAADHAAGKIPRAVHIALDDFSSGGYPARLDQMSRDRTIVVYCASGCSSAEYVAQRIREFGFEKTLILADGFAAWKEKGLPVEGRGR